MMRVLSKLIIYYLTIDNPLHTMRLAMHYQIGDYDELWFLSSNLVIYNLMI